jgi:DNA-binding transcriptional MerR regulator
MIASTVEIPNRSLFRQPEVCEIAQVQPYVLRSWEAEFPDLGVSKSANSPRVYRRADLERVLRLKHLLFVEGLTLAGARRKLEAEHGPAVSDVPGELDALIGNDVRERLMLVKRGLRELQMLLDEKPNGNARLEPFVLKEPKPRTTAQKKKPVKKAGKKRAS